MSNPMPAPAPDTPAARLRALLDAGPPAPPKGGARSGHDDAVRAHAAAVDALRYELAEAFAKERGWRATTAPLAVKELARRAPSGSAWHRPAREWPAALRHLSFFRDEGHRAAAAVAHPLAADMDPAAITVWAADHDLVATFPDVASWEEPGVAFVAVLEPAVPLAPGRASEPAEAGRRSAEARRQSPAAAPAPEPTPEVAHPDPAPSTAPSLPDMRPVAPIDLDGAEPADLAGQDAPSWDVVAPTELLVDEAYQRALSPKSLALVRRIATAWSWAKFKPPVCARVDGRLHVVDGQHTAIGAASHGGIPLIPVLVVDAPEMADRAAAFVSHATSALPTTIVQVHQAAVLAGDEDAVTIDRVCRAAGIDLVAFPPPRSAYRPRQTIALNAIRRLVDRRGAMRARQVLEALARADLAPIAADHIRAAEALLCDPDLSGELDAERVAAGLRTLAARGFAEARTLAATKNLVLWRAMVALVLKGARARPRGGRRGDRPTDGADAQETAA